MKEHRVIVPYYQAIRMACAACEPEIETRCTQGPRSQCAVVIRTLRLWRNEGMVMEDPITRASQVLKELDSDGSFKHNSNIGAMDAVRILKAGFEQLLEEREKK